MITSTDNEFDERYQLSVDARQWFNHMADELQLFYRTSGHGMTPRDLFVEIERRFGDRLFTDVCVPHGYHAGGCIALAVEVAKEPKVA